MLFSKKTATFALHLSKEIKVHLALFVVSLFYGATYTMAKEVMPQYIAANGFILLRVIVACILFLIFHALYIKEKVERKDIIPLAISAFFGAAANMLLFFKGLEITTPINASVLMMVTPIFVLLISVAWKKEKLSVLKVIGCLIAAFGAMLLMGGRMLHFSAETLEGDIYIILNAISYAIYLVYVRRLTIKYSPVTVSKWNFIFGFLYVLPFGFSDLQIVHWDAIPAVVWVYIGFISVGTTFIAYLLSAYALQKASSSLVGTYIYLQPVIATLIAVFSGKDFLNIEKMLFILLIFAGVYLVSLKTKIKADGN